MSRCRLAITHSNSMAKDKSSKKDRKDKKRKRDREDDEDYRKEKAEKLVSVLSSETASGCRCCPSSVL